MSRAGGISLLLAIAWTALFSPVLRWLAGTFASEAFRFNLLLLVASVSLLVARALRARPRGLLALLRELGDAHLRLRVAPLALITGAISGYLLVEHSLDVHIASAALFGLATYGLVGLYVTPTSWRRALVPALLLIAVLPFGEQANTYAGFAARVATARFVSAALSSLSIASLGSETVLLLESGVAYVDVPCSGIKSLWTGLVFFLAATHVERAPTNLRWVFSGAVFAVLVFAANVARVTVIVLLVAGGHGRVAEVLHEPLGLVGFGFACAAAVVMLARRDHGAEPVSEGTLAQETVSLRPAPRSSHAGAAALVAAVAVTAILRPSEQTPSPAPPRTVPLQLPPELHGRPAPLTAAESGLFERTGGTFAEKHHFRSGPLAGTVLFVLTTRWRAHHPPELCLASAGARIDALETVSFGPGRELRVARLDGGRRTALYWFQSEQRTTGELLDRVLSDLRGEGPRWMLVTVLLETGSGSEPQLREVFERFFHIARAALAERAERDVT